ncbi:MAG TPA: CopD family protein [Caulobacteraceae bacterium]|nr:CopD family protein [Caulobacteraceae bacterium]
MSDAVDPALVAVRFFAYGLAMLAFGRASFDLYAPAAPPGRAVLGGASALLALAALAYATLLAREAVGAAGWPDAAAVAMVWSATGFGRALALSAAAALALALLSLARRPLRWPRLGLAAMALGALAFVGHGADDTGLRGGARLGVLAIHLLAVAAWLGALPMLWLALARERRPLALLDRFGWVGGVSLALMLATGAATLVFVALDARGGLGGAYVRTLVVKLAFVLGLIILAAVNRFRLTPMMARAPDRARRLLRATIVAEQALGLGALASVALLGQLDPSM